MTAIGVKIFFLDFEPSGTAACSLFERFRSEILLNSRIVNRRRNFDLAHELFHLLTWNVFRVPVSENALTSLKREELLSRGGTMAKLNHVRTCLIKRATSLFLQPTRSSIAFLASCIELIKEIRLKRYLARSD
ncbi:hypothetical protein VN12_25280 [Pirellula sp. SH-Sr6A]|nr:hypothetical protein VN12_25280 [Pirellula sp. SH-Sr6A]